MQQDNRNLIIFIICGVVIFTVYQFFVINPRQEKVTAERAAAAKLEQQKAAAAAASTSAPPGVTAPGAAPAPPAPGSLSMPAALAQSPRIRIDTPSLSGSIALRGARIDELSLKNYAETQEPGSPRVGLLRPQGAPFAYFAELGWTGANLPGLPTAETVWTAPEGAVLTPRTPVTLTYQSPQGLVFTRTISIDENYLFKITDAVDNWGQAPVTIVPGGEVVRQGLPLDIATGHPLGSNQIVHEGGIGWLDGQLRQFKYPGWRKMPDGGKPIPASQGGWFGITDKYWMTVIVPDQRQQIAVAMRTEPTGDENTRLYRTSYTGTPQTIPVGRRAVVTTHIFAGAKQAPLLEEYGRQLGAPKFHNGVDWGNFWIFTRPLFWILDFFNTFFANFGLAILALTVVVKLAFFPLANKSYESITKMKKVQPLIEELRTKYKDDPAEQQKQMMAIYQQEKVNPFMGCIPMLLQIPVFYALYKVLTVTIEMRHAPFFGYIKDLSAREPYSIWTLFGLIPWDPATVPLIGGLLDGFLHLGILALFYGFTMWLTTAMSPQTGIDPIQRRIFALMPLIFTLTLANFAVGLLIYWIWSNLLSIVQQYVIMRRFKVENPIDDFFARFAKPKAAGG